jgi:hypothetical protein
VVGPRVVSPSIPPLTQRNPAYLTISTVFGRGCPRSGKVETTPMLFRKSVAARAVEAVASLLAVVKSKATKPPLEKSASMTVCPRQIVAAEPTSTNSAATLAINAALITT